MSFNQSRPTIVVGMKPPPQQADNNNRLEDENNNNGQTNDNSNMNTNRAHSQITLTNTASELSSSDEIAHKFR